VRPRSKAYGFSAPPPSAGTPRNAPKRIRKKLLTQFFLFSVFEEIIHTTGGVFCSQWWCERASCRARGATAHTTKTKHPPCHRWVFVEGGTFGSVVSPHAPCCEGGQNLILGVVVCTTQKMGGIIRPGFPKRQRLPFAASLGRSACLCQRQ